MHALRLILLATIAALAMSACSSASPQLKVIGVGQAQSRGPGVGDARMLVVFVEVVNSTNRDLELSKLEYDLAADSWFSSTGAVRLSREVNANSTAVVEIPVPYTARARAGEVAYQFRGKLFANDAHVERTWKITQAGTLGEGEIAVRPIGITTRIADGDE